MRIVFSGWIKPLTDVRVALALLFTISFVGLAFPYGFPLFLPLSIVTFGWFILARGINLRVTEGVVLLALCFFFYLTGVMRTGLVYDQNRDDLFSAAAILTVGLTVTELRKGDNFWYFKDLVQRMASLILGCVAVLSIYKFALLLGGERIGFFEVEGRPYPLGTSLVPDYNFYAFAMGVGAVSSLWQFRRSLWLVAKCVYLGAFSITVLAGMLSGSRRFFLAASAGLVCLSAFGLFRALRGILRLLRTGALGKRAVKGWTALVTVMGLAYLTASLVTLGSMDRHVVEKVVVRWESLLDVQEAAGSRLDRWDYAIDLLDGGTAIELFVGGGFDYLRRYAQKFSTEGGEDYPHNPLVSALLYSGILGTVPLAVLFLRALMKYFEAWRYDLFFFFLFLAGSFFLFMSANSIFSTKFFPLLLIIPWVIPRGRSLKTRRRCG